MSQYIFLYFDHVLLFLNCGTGKCCSSIFCFTFYFFLRTRNLYLYRFSRFHESSKMKIIDKNKARGKSIPQKSLLTTVTTTTSKHISIPYKHCFSLQYLSIQKHLKRAIKEMLLHLTTNKRLLRSNTYQSRIYRGFHHLQYVVPLNPVLFLFLKKEPPKQFKQL